MLGSSMTCSCGYWKDAGDLQQAQINKLDLLCRKLDLRPGDRLVDIGCGWGSLARHAARNYGAQVTEIKCPETRLDKYPNNVSAPVCQLLQGRKVKFRNDMPTLQRTMHVGRFRYLHPAEMRIL